MKLSFSSPITTAHGSLASSAARSQLHTLALNSKPNFSRKRLTGRLRLDSKMSRLRSDGEDERLSVIELNHRAVEPANSVMMR